MNKYFISTFAIVFSIILPTSINLMGQTPKPTVEGLEISEKEGIPVIIMHLPDWESKRNEAVFIRNENELKKALGEREVFNAVEFLADTEAVSATYPEGKLLIVEYGTPQASSYTDKKVTQYLAAARDSKPVFYKRIGNYNVFLFDGQNESDANALFSKIKYEKVIRWLSYDPFAQNRAERGFIRDTKDLFLATALAVFVGLSIAMAFGLLAGFIFYRFRLRKRMSLNAFSDGGGLTRLNLDHLTSKIASKSSD